MYRWLTVAGSLILFAYLLLAATQAQDGAKPVQPRSADIDFFENRIRPIFAEHCYSCHGPQKQKGELRLDSAAAIRKGGESGVLFIPGKPAESLILQAVNYSEELKMPPKQKLPDQAIQLLTEWVQRGAVLPNDEAKAQNAPWKSHWAFQPLLPSALGREGQAERRNGNAIDHFIKAKLQAANLDFAPPADRRTLLRRAKFDLLGLPPTYEEVQQFVNDPASDEAAFATVVDRYLASSHFGERWGRHWLDLARYADNKGYIGVNVDRSYPFAWTYRDWVVNALNQDMPYDRFLVCQLAADQLGLKDDQRDLAAMGFLTVGRRFINNIHDIIDDRIDVTTRTMLGLTVQCSRCHDHKYDPITMADYYGLYGVFNSSKEPDLENMPLLGMKMGGAETEAFEKELAHFKDDLAKWDKDHEADRKDKPIQFGEQRKPFENKIKRLYADHPGAPPRGMVLMDREKPIEPVIFNRGSPGNRGPKVPRQYISFLKRSDDEPFKKGSGRLELAQKIASSDNPLTARVWVNRVWSHLIGQALVRTPSDFGLRSEPPSHPELLDHLAGSLLQSHWSTKALIRQIMLSRTYRQYADSPASWKTDVENKLVGRMNRKRLEWEPLRDSLLYVSGRIDLKIGGPSVELEKKDANRRSLYAFIDRQNLPGLYRTFDFAIPDTHSPQRFTTTVPQQALYFLNSDFVVTQAQDLLDLPEIKNTTDTTVRLQKLFERCYAREAGTEEIELMVKYLQSHAVKDAWLNVTQALLATNEFLFVD
jgi:hypothetical protein